MEIKSNHKNWLRKLSIRNEKKNGGEVGKKVG